MPPSAAAGAGKRQNKEHEKAGGHTQPEDQVEHPVQRPAIRWAAPAKAENPPRPRAR